MAEHSNTDSCGVQDASQGSSVEALGAAMLHMKLSSWRLLGRSSGCWLKSTAASSRVEYAVISSRRHLAHRQRLLAHCSPAHA